MKDPEPWFLLTNLPEDITGGWYLTVMLNGLRLKKLSRMLVAATVRVATGLKSQLSSVPYYCLYSLLVVLWRYAANDYKTEVPPKKQLSWFRQAWNTAALITYTTIAPIPLQRGGKVSVGQLHEMKAQVSFNSWTNGHDHVSLIECRKS